MSRACNHETGMPILPEGYFWRVKNDRITNSPYLHLMKEIDLYFFKWPISIRNEYIALGLTRENRIDTAHEIMDWFEPNLTNGEYGDFR